MEASAIGHVQGELEAARVAIVSLLAVITDEQFRSVETALKALGAMSETASAALERLRHARDQQPPEEAEVRLTIEARLGVPEPGVDVI